MNHVLLGYAGMLIVLSGIGLAIRRSSRKSLSGTPFWVAIAAHVAGIGWLVWLGAR